MNTTGIGMANAAGQACNTSRAESVVVGARHINQHLCAVIDRLTTLRDKIAGGEPTTADDKEGPKQVPCGFLAMLECEGENMASRLSRLDSLLSSVERHF